MKAIGKCLASDCDEMAMAGRRGLCGKHYQQFVRTRKTLPEHEREEFEAMLIHEGQLLVDRAGNRSAKNPFDEAKHRFISKRKRKRQ